jgi:uncharacterized protein YjbI with pentapeptide repeats
MANPEHLELLRQGVVVWNAWRAKDPSNVPDLRQADLGQADLGQADLSQADLSRANLGVANLSRANLSYAILRETILLEADLGQANLRGASLGGANLRGADLSGAILGMANLGGADLRRADLSRAKLGRANLTQANLGWADFSGADLEGADLAKAHLFAANLRGANLSRASFFNANLGRADLRGADLRRADLKGADLSEANFSHANLAQTDLVRAQLVEANLVDATLTDCRIYGISAWGVKLSAGTIQQGMIITPENEPAVTVDDLKVAQFVYLLLSNENIRDVIDTVGKKGVLLLGRFTEGRLAVLERLRDELRKRGYLPIVFNFDKPETKDFTETVRLLAGLSKFVIADVTNPKSAPVELQATVPEIMVPFRPIIEEGEKPFAMLQDLWIKHRDWVFEPIYYSSVDALVGSLDEKIIRPAERRFADLLARKAERMKGEHV